MTTTIEQSFADKMKAEGWREKLKNRNAALSFFSRIPIVSFYPNTLRAIGILKSSADIEQTLAGQLHTSTLKKGDAYFSSISKIISTAYNAPGFDEIRLKRSEGYLTGINILTQKLIIEGGDCFVELLKNNEIQKRIDNIDDQFSDIRRELNRIARKRLAIAVLVFGLAAVLVEVLL